MGVSMGFWRRTAPALALLGAALAVPGACGGPQEAVGKGEACFRADDCAPGLVCITGVCDDDLSKIVSQVDGPATAPDTGAAGSAGAAGAADSGGDAGGASGNGGAAGMAGAATGGSAGAGGSAGGTGGSAGRGGAAGSAGRGGAGGSAGSGGAGGSAAGMSGTGGGGTPDAGSD
jgi:hypothetical protein